MIQRLLPFLLVTIYSASLHGAMVNNMAIRAGSRGLMFVLESDELLRESHTVSKAEKNTILAITLNNALYGLDDFSFNAFPEHSRVKKIAVTEKTNGSISIFLTIDMDLPKQVLTKSDHGRTLFLVSTTPCNEYAWTATGASTGSGQEENRIAGAALQEKSSPAVVQDIRFLKRGAVDQLSITSDKPVYILTQKKNSTIVAVFDNTIRGIARKDYLLPESSPFVSLTIKESAQNGVPRVGVVLVTRMPLQSFFVQVLPRQCIFYSINPDDRDNSGLVYWEHDNPNNYAASLSGSTYIANDNTRNNTVPDAPTKTLERIVIVRDKVNFRSEPTTESNDNLIGTLHAGMKGYVFKKQGQWLYIKIDGEGTEGWVYRSMVLDSALVTTAQWNTFASTVRRKQSPPAPEIYSSTGFAGGVPHPVQGLATPDVMQENTAASSPENSKRVVSYHKYGRDPFLPLNLADFLQSELVSVEQSKLVGILYGASDRIALVEDASKAASSFALREKDAVKNGQVLRIKPDEVIFLLNDAGFSRTFTLKLNPKEE